MSSSARAASSWRGQESLAAAAKQGYSGLLSYGYYLDLMWPTARHYAVGSDERRWRYAYAGAAEADSGW